MNTELIELTKEAQKGDMEAFSKLIMNFEQDLYRIASIRLNSEYDIEDVMQMTIEQSLKNIKKLKNPQYIKTWIIRNLINNCNSIYKRKKEKIEFNTMFSLYSIFSFFLL